MPIASSICCFIILLLAQTWSSCHGWMDRWLDGSMDGWLERLSLVDIPGNCRSVNDGINRFFLLHGDVPHIHGRILLKENGARSAHALNGRGRQAHCIQAGHHPMYVRTNLSRFFVFLGGSLARCDVGAMAVEAATMTMVKKGLATVFGIVSAKSTTPVATDTI
jgi:hypothetical protein